MLPQPANFFGQPPTHQNALDVFKDEWSTRLPDALGLIASTGPTRLCEDYRVTWAARELRGFSGKRVLELGPLEGGHSYMLEQLGAGEIVSIEANTRAFLRCLVLKEIFGLTRTRFLLGDFIPFLRTSTATFDVGFACGVLYHQSNPVELIRLLASRCRAVFVWTVYFDPEHVARNPSAAQAFEKTIDCSVAGFSHTLHQRSYTGARDWKGFCGGGEATACWMTQPAILAAFEFFGFRLSNVITEQNQNGPAMMFVAEKAKSR